VHKFIPIIYIVPVKIICIMSINYLLQIEKKKE